MLQHQMVQSPARLGLTNPTSPSLPGQQQPQTTVASAAAANSSSSSSPAAANVLLPLLPPLRRAQTLLAQMASLAARLFELSPNRAAWLSSFRGSLPAFLSAAAPPPPPGPASTKEALAQFSALQTQLFEAVAQLQEILNLQDARAKLAREVRAKDAAALAFAARLKDAERLLDALLDDYSHYRKRPVDDDNGDDEDDEGDSAAAATTTVASRLNLSDILSYAHRISYTTFAPPEFGAGQGPLRGALPPAPQDEQMRASQLYAFASLDVGVPATAEPRGRGFEPMIEAPPAQPPAAAVPDFGVMPPNITVPAGWKPGMPVELPMDIPLPPPGWKPGDPVALPPMPMPNLRADQIQMPPLPAKPAAETIHVRPVQLDILDQDDDSSDYSGDDASSDTDD